MTAKISLETIKKQMYDLVKDEYKIVGDYQNESTYTLVWHKKCNKTYKVRMYHFFGGRRCPYCRYHVKTQEEFQKQVDEKTNNKYKVIDKYINMKTKIRFECRDCKTIFKMSPKNLFYEPSISCPTCRVPYVKPIISNEEFLKRVHKKGIDKEFTFLEPYRGTNVPIKIKHKCGYIFYRKPNNILQIRGCPKCSKKIKRTTASYAKEVQEKTHGEYKVIGKYKNTDTKIKIQHKCGTTYEVYPVTILKGYNLCPKCYGHQYHGEQMIIFYLKDNNIQYESQKKFHDLIDKKRLSYDFYLPNYNLLIEYQGQQHYESRPEWGGEKQLQLQQKHDNLKRQYAKDHGYKLLEIKYTNNKQQQINKILDKELAIKN